MPTEIEKKALDLLDRYQIYDAPVKVSLLAGEMGVDITYQDLDNHVSGVLVITDDNRAGIALNEFHHTNRQRFTIAHELGHYVLHKSDRHLFIDARPTYFRDNKASEGTDSLEIQANAFAAALLMPERIVLKLIKDNKFDIFDEYDVSNLASLLEVSEQALTIRLVNLGLIRP